MEKLLRIRSDAMLQGQIDRAIGAAILELRFLLIDVSTRRRVMIPAFFGGGIMAKAKLARRIVAWSKDDVRTLKSLAKAKLSGTAVAKRLKRSPGAVAQKAMKLKVRFRSVRRKRA
jgi:hypothetical protein